MAAKANKQLHTGGGKTKPQFSTTAAEGYSKTNDNSVPASWLAGKGLKRRGHIMIAAAIAAITWLCIQTCLSNAVNLWDDNGYLRDDMFIKDISWHGLKNIFSNPVMGNYHPLTILSYAIEYSMVQLEPWLYHFDSMVMHVVVTMLVYWFVLLLSRRTMAAVITAFLFGLHPMHIESVAWVSGRKDLLCAVFYIAACICWLYYLRGEKGYKKWWYIIVIVLFICSLLSKGTAVTLPLTLLLIDYFEKRPFGRNVFIEKIPHFILALVFGILSIKVQHAAGAMDMQKVVYNPMERIALGGYALITYLWKAILPAGLHCLYPYPPKVNGALPLFYYLYPAVVAALIFAVWKYARKNKAVVFGLLFFIANIALMLQFIPVGEAIVAERYSYIPYIGLFFIAGWWVSDFFEAGNNKPYRNIILGATIFYIACLGYNAYERCGAWHDETSLWTDEIAKEPVLAPQAYNNLGYIYTGKWAAATDPDEKKADYDSSVYLLNKAIALKPDFVNPYVALGEMQRSARQYDAAKTTFYRALRMNPKEANVCLELAILYLIIKDYDSSGYFFREEVQLEGSSGAYGNYGNFLESVNKNDSALMEYNKAISMSADNYILFANRGKLLQKLKRWDEANKDFETAIRMNPDNAELYYLRSYCDTEKKNNALALQDVEKALSLGYKHVDTGYYKSLRK